LRWISLVPPMTVNAVCARTAASASAANRSALSANWASAPRTSAH
jgi:hypothetical protein